MLLKSFPSFTLQEDSWVNVNLTLDIPVGSPLGVSVSRNKKCYLYVNNTPPPTSTDGFLITDVSNTSTLIEIAEGSETVWVKGRGSRVNIHTTFTETPAGVYEGLRAITVQDYVEANVKLGVQHEGSVLLPSVPAGASNDTIFLTGNLPVSLKGRRVSYSGVGVSAYIYENPVYSGGSNAVYQNANSINPSTGLSQIIIGTTVSSLGDLIFAPVHSLGNLSNQGKGAVVSALETEHVLSPNTAYLLRLTSLESSQPQNIASHLTWYEGLLDLPRP